MSEEVFLGVDPGFTGGAIVALKKSLEVVAHRAWAAKSADIGLAYATDTAEAFKERFPDARLFYETAYIKYFLQRGISEEKIQDIIQKLRRGGSIHLPGGYSSTSLSVSECIGVFRSRWVHTNSGLPAGEWRRYIKLKKEKEEDWKDVSRREALRKLPRGTRIRAAIYNGNDHLADAFNLARGGIARLRERVCVLW